jgi:hypothetical protein
MDGFMPVQVRQSRSISPLTCMGRAWMLELLDCMILF